MKRKYNQTIYCDKFSMEYSQQAVGVSKVKETRMFEEETNLILRGLVKK